MGKKSQIISMDLVISIIIFIIFFGLILSFSFNTDLLKKKDIDPNKIYNNLQKNIINSPEKEKVDFLSNSLLNIEAYSYFGNYSINNNPSFREYFFNNTYYQNADVCIFMMDKHNKYLEINGNFGYGKVYNNLFIKEECSSFLKENKSPCTMYEKANSFIKLFFYNNTYYNFYILICE
jgi:hypothetical protein